VQGPQTALRSSTPLLLNEATMSTKNDSFLERILEPVSSSLNDDAARKLIKIRADARSRARVARLARKCNSGKLSADEREEYEAYVMAGELIAILQAKARLHLARRARPE
jgi:hypothetical protein